MSHAVTALLFVVGSALLIAGADLLVRGGSRLAAATGLPPLVIGLTVVAFGTSSPELAVTAGSAWTGQSDVALGNVVGSNIFNVLCILGLSALATPLVVAASLVRRDVPLAIAVSTLPLLLGLDGRIGRLDGLLLCGGIVAYTAALVYRRPTTDPAPTPDRVRPAGSRLGDGLLAGTGLLLLVVGARWVIDAAAVMAASLGVSERVIGLTIVAAGTSLPELATSVLAALRGERDIAVGNIVGSNIFNILAVLGVGGLVAAEGLAVAPGMLTVDIPIMIAVAVALLPVSVTGLRITRTEGGLFLGCYVAYTAHLTLDATNRSGAPAVGRLALWSVLLLAGATLVVVAIRRRRW